MKTIIAVIFMMGFITFSVQAEETGPCHDDYQKLCKDIQPGEGRIAKCLKENESKLSQACKDHHAKMKEERKETREACHDDMKKYCGEVKAGGGSKMKCMKENKDKFSQECKDSMEKMKSLRKEKK